MIFDLHMHTTSSDGVLSPRELVSHAARCGVSLMAITDHEALQAAFELTRLEGIIPALESSHALAMLPKMKFQPDDIVVLTVSGRGDKDLATYLAHKEEIYYDNI